jgi:protein phosphatase 1 regulatory subunit 12A
MKPILNVLFAQPDGEALSAAAKAGKLDEVVALVEGGAPIEWANVGGLTALHAASDGGHRDVVALLLSHSAEVNAHTNFHKTPLLLAATMGHSAVGEMAFSAPF